MSLSEDAHTDDWINWLRQWSESDEWSCWELFDWAHCRAEEVRTRLEDVIGIYQSILAAFDKPLPPDELYEHMDAFEEGFAAAEKLLENAADAIDDGPPREGLQ